MSPLRSYRRPRRRHAFTLMEVLLVLAILVILGSLAVFAFGNAKAEANIKAAKAQIGGLETPINLFLDKYNRYPNSLDELENPPPTANGAASNILEKKIPLDPWQNPYQYRAPGQHNPQGYDLYSFGPEGVEGPNVIGNW